jgi:hypothetical protein
MAMLVLPIIDVTTCGNPHISSVTSGDGDEEITGCIQPTKHKCCHQAAAIATATTTAAVTLPAMQPAALVPPLTPPLMPHCWPGQASRCRHPRSACCRHADAAKLLPLPHCRCTTATLPPPPQTVAALLLLPLRCRHHQRRAAAKMSPPSPLPLFSSSLLLLSSLPFLSPLPLPLLVDC